MELQMKDVQAALAKLLNHYPEAGHNATSVSKLALDWFDLFSEENITQKQFSAGIRHAVKNCSYFPKVVDVLNGVRIHKETPTAPKSNHLQLSDSTSSHDLTPEEIARNKARLQAITDMLAGKISMDAAIDAVGKQSHIEEFGA